MDLKRFLSSWEGTRGENRFHRPILLFLSVALVLALVKVLDQEPVVTMEPPMKLSQTVDIQKDTASTEYRKTWALFAAQMLGNATPDNVDFVKEAILPIIDASIYQQVRDSLNRQIQEVRQGGLTVHFSPRQTIHEPATGKFFVMGQQVTEAPSGPSQKERRVYEVKVKIQDYQPVITHLTAYEGQPRTQKYLENRKNRDENGGE